jgi:beta-ureidopropionase
MYFVGALNRIGVEDLGDNDFYGTSYFADPRGQVVDGTASDQEAELVVRDLDLGLIDQARAGWAFYRDRRPDTYGPLTEA